jgi:uncharacterized protein (TIRG00374 family)
MIPVAETPKPSEIGQVRQDRWKSRVRALLAIAVLGALLALAVRTIDFRQVAHAMSLSDWRLVVLSGVIAVTVCMMACSLRLWLLTVPLPTTGTKIGFWPLTSIYYASSAAHHLLPAPAAEVLRTVHLKRRYGYSIGALVACQLVEKVIDALCLALEILVVALVSTLPVALGWSLYAFSILAAGGVLAVVIVAARHRDQQLPEGAGRMRAFVHRLSEAMYLLRSPRIWAASMLCSFVNDVANAATVGLCLYAVGVSLPMPSWFIVVLVARIAGLLPSTPGQFGVMEAGMAVAMVALGVDRNLALAAAVLYHVAHFVPVTLVGLFELRRQWQEAS